MRFPMNAPAGAPRVLRSAMSLLWVLFFIAMSLGRTAKMICGGTMIVVGLTVSVVALVQKRNARRLGRFIEVGDAGISLYAPSWFDDVHLILPWTAIESVTRIGSRRRFLHLHATGGRIYSIAANTLLAPNDLVVLAEAITQKIAGSAGGTARLAKNLADQEAADAILARRAPATWTFAILCTVVFLGEMASGAISATGLENDPFGLLRWGANAPLLVKHGEWFRLLTANLLHGSAVHLGMNLLSFLVVGIILEKILGTSRMLILTLVTGATGALASCVASRAVLSVGASTAIFGLLGALAVVQFLGDVPPIFRGRRNAWIFVAVANIALPYFMPTIDWVGHLGGLVGGVLVALLLVRRNRPIAPPRLLVHLSAAVLVALYLFSVARVAFDARARTTRLSFLQAMVDSPSSLHAEEVNNFVWTTVLDPAATPDELAASLVLARRDLETAGPNERDTAALAEHLAGHDDAALALEVFALEGGVKGAAAHVLLYATDRNDPKIETPAAPGESVHLVLALTETADPFTLQALLDACIPPADIDSLVASRPRTPEETGTRKPVEASVLFYERTCPTSITRHAVEYPIVADMATRANPSR